MTTSRQPSTNCLFKSCCIRWLLFLVFVQVLHAALQYEDPCKKDDPATCTHPNLTCSDNLTCACSNDYVKDDDTKLNDVVCVKKNTYGNTCTPDNYNTCIDNDTVCIPDVNNTNRCLCYSSFFRDANGACRPLDDVAVKILTTTRTTDTVMFTWSADKHGHDVLYTIESTQGEGHLLGSADEHGATWGNLSSGQKYSFSITTTIPAESYYPTKTVAVYKGDVWTEPRKPGTVSSVRLVSGDPKNGYFYNVSFEKSQGEVIGYSLVINQEERTGASTTYTFSTLHPGQDYNYTIIAYNGIHDPSEPSTGSISTDVYYPGEVRNLAISQDENNPTKFTLSFLCPDEKALGRNVRAYGIVKTLLSSGIQQANETYKFGASTSSCYNSFPESKLGGVIADRNYLFSVRAWNDEFVGSYNHISFYAKSTGPEDSDNLALWLGIGLGLGCLVILCLVGGLLIYRKCRTHNYDKPGPVTYTTPTYAPIIKGPPASPPPHAPASIGYIDPESIPQYFSYPGHGGSTHTYLEPQEPIYDFIRDDHAYIAGSQGRQLEPYDNNRTTTRNNQT